MLNEQEAALTAEKFELIFQKSFDLALQSGNMIMNHINLAIEKMDHSHVVQTITLKELIYFLNCMLNTILIKRGIPHGDILKFMRDDIKRAEKKVVEVLNDINEAKNDK